MKPNKKTILCIVFVFALLAELTSLSVKPARAAGDLYVVPGGNDTNDCASPTTPCATIQGAIDKAPAGSVIRVAVGMYTTTLNPNQTAIVVQITKSLDLSGGWDTAFADQEGLSTVDGQNEMVGVKITGSTVVVNMDHFLVQNGYFPYVYDNSEKLAGGITNLSTLTLSYSRVTNNLSLSNSGGIFNSGVLNIDHSEISNNHTNAYGGGGIANEGSLVITSSRINNNVGEVCGGGIYNLGHLTVTNSSITGNTALQAGGIFNREYVYLTNVTISNNISHSHGGGLFNAPFDSAEARLNNVTIFENLAYQEGGGIFTAAQSTIVKLYMKNSIVSRNTLQYPTYTSRDCAGTITNEGYNLVGDMSGCAFSDTVLPNLTGLDPQLLPLAHGQYFDYYPLASDSQLINAGNPDGCTDTEGNPLTTDQRGASRADRCDIGAYEYTIPGPVAALMIVLGDHQSTLVNQPFEDPLQVRAFDSFGSPVEEGDIQFAAPTSGASGIFEASGMETIVSTTDEGGFSTPLTFSANDLAGLDRVTASPLVGSGSVEFSLTNIGQIFMPVIVKPDPAEIVREVPFTDRCASTYVTNEGENMAKVTECIIRVRIRADRQMYFDMRWSVQFLNSDVTSLYKYSDADNYNMYITDSLNNRYDHIDTGGAASELTYFYPWGPLSADGWFMFPAPKPGVTMFTFHDDDNEPPSVIGNIDLSY